LRGCQPVVTVATVSGHGHDPGPEPSAGAQAFELETSLGYLVGMVSRRMTRELNQQLQPFGVTAAQFVVLAVLWEQDGLAQNLIADDNRYQRVYLTPAGRRLRETLPALAAGVNEAAAADLSADDLAVLRSLLGRVRTALGVARIAPGASGPEPVREGW